MTKSAIAATTGHRWLVRDVAFRVTNIYAAV
jgi:hypothetical protein